MESGHNFHEQGFKLPNFLEKGNFFEKVSTLFKIAYQISYLKLPQNKSAEILAFKGNNNWTSLLY
jgi:hypothetical protein